MTAPFEMTAGRSLIHDPIMGVTVVAAAAVTAVDLLGDGAELTATEALGLLGAGAPAEFDPERFARTSGVNTRHWVRGSEEGPAELGALAAVRALEAASWEADDVGLVIAATSTPVAVSRCLAREIGKLIGSGAPAVDVRAGGAGGLEAWIVGASRTRAARRCLVIATECPSLYGNPTDPVNALLFGDGAAALCLESGGGEDGLILGRSCSYDGPGTPFSVAGRIDGTEPKAFSCPSPDYAAALADVWSREGAILGAMARENGGGFELAPYAVGARQLAALEDSAGLDAGSARDRLARTGSLGCAAPLVAVADRLALDPGASLAAVAVGGGIASCSLLWRHT